MNWRIALSALDYGPEEDAAVRRVMESRWLSMGPEVAAFEQEFAATVGAKHAIAVSNATTALHLALRAVGVGSGDEVIQPALNFVATANMTVATGARPAFADIVALDEPTIDPARIAELISPRTKAVVVMHYGGYPCRMAQIVQLCASRNLALIEDACHAPAVEYGNECKAPPHGRQVGRLGDIACFSFFGNKNIATGEGGMITTDRDDLATTVHRLRSHGMTTLTWDRHRGHASSYDVVQYGYNYRMDEIRAALGRAQLARLAAGNARRRQLTKLYHQLLEDVADVVMPFKNWKWDHAGHLMPLLARDAQHRASIVEALKSKLIQTSLHYPPIANFSAFREFADTPLAITQEFGTRVMTLPLHPRLTEAEVASIVDVIKAA